MAGLGNQGINLQLETHPGFERLWRGIQWGVLLFLGAMVVSALAGLFGAGPAARMRQPLGVSGATLDHQRFARVQAPSQLTIEPVAVQPTEFHIHLDQTLVEKMGIESASPTPLYTAADPTGTLYVFALAPGARGKIAFKARALKPGIARGIVRVEGDAIPVTQIIWP